VNLFVLVGLEVDGQGTEGRLGGLAAFGSESPIAVARFRKQATSWSPVQTRGNAVVKDDQDDEKKETRFKVRNPRTRNMRVSSSESSETSVEYGKRILGELAMNAPSPVRSPGAPPSLMTHKGRKTSSLRPSVLRA